MHEIETVFTSAESPSENTMKSQQAHQSASQKQKIRASFTLIELLVVVAILSILMAILLPALLTAKETAKDIICKNQMKQMGLSMQNYMADNNSEFWYSTNYTNWYDTKITAAPEIQVLVYDYQLIKIMRKGGNGTAYSAPYAYSGLSTGIFCPTTENRARCSTYAINQNAALRRSADQCTGGTTTTPKKWNASCKRARKPEKGVMFAESAISSTVGMPETPLGAAGWGTPVGTNFGGTLPIPNPFAGSYNESVMFWSHGGKGFKYPGDGAMELVPTSGRYIYLLGRQNFVFFDNHVQSFKNNECRGQNNWQSWMIYDWASLRTNSAYGNN